MCTWHDAIFCIHQQVLACKLRHEIKTCVSVATPSPLPAYNSNTFFAVVACFYFVVLSNVFILILIVLTLRFLDKIVVLSSDNKGVGAFWTSVSWSASTSCCFSPSPIVAILCVAAPSCRGQIVRVIAVCLPHSITPISEEYGKGSTSKMQEER